MQNEPSNNRAVRSRMLSSEDGVIHESPRANFRSSNLRETPIREKAAGAPDASRHRKTHTPSPGSSSFTNLAVQDLQRRYPQPPPPSKNNTKRMINIVSIASSRACISPFRIHPGRNGAWGPALVKVTRHEEDTRTCLIAVTSASCAAGFRNPCERSPASSSWRSTSSVAIRDERQRHLPLHSTLEERK